MQDRSPYTGTHLGLITSEDAEEDLQWKAVG